MKVDAVEDGSGPMKIAPRSSVDFFTSSESVRA